jgi:hypothetical protein
VSRVGTDGSGLVVVASGIKAASGVAVDDAYVYWVDAGSFNTTTMWFGTDGAIARTPK